MEKIKKIIQFTTDKIARAILFLIFIFAIIPTKILMVLAKRDRLRLKENKNSYWLEANNDNDFEVQY